MSGGSLLTIFLPLTVRQKNVGTERRPQDVSEANTLLGGGDKNKYPREKKQYVKDLRALTHTLLRKEKTAKAVSGNAYRATMPNEARGQGARGRQRQCSTCRTRVHSGLGRSRCGLSPLGWCRCGQSPFHAIWCAISPDKRCRHECGQRCYRADRRCRVGDDHYGRCPRVRQMDRKILNRSANQ